MPLNKPSDFFEQKENEENLSDEKTKVETQKRILSPSGLLDEKEEVVVEENIEEEVVVVDNTEDKNYQKIIELEKLVEQVKSQVSSIPKVIDYRKDIGQLSIELDRLRKAFGLSEAEKLLSKPVEFPEIKSYDEDIELLHKLVADIERKQEIVSLSEGLLDEPNSDSEKNFATLEDLSEHYRLFVNRIQQQLSTLGGGGIEDAPKSGGPYVRQGQKWVVSSLSDGDWIRDSVGINTTDSVGIGTTAKSAYQLYVEGNARVTGVLTVGQESITLNGDTNTLDLGGSSISKDSGGDLKIMGSGGGYAPVRASEFKIDADTVIDGNKNISAGIVTGVTYYGDGSNLTGIIAVGIGTTASINTSGIITASVLSSTTGTFGTVNVSGASTFSDEVSFGSTATFGTSSQNIQIYTDSSGTPSSTIKETGSGNFRILGNKIVFLNTADNRVFAEFNNGGSIELYHNNSKKFETTGVGVSILNGTSETATIYGPSNLIIDPMPVGVGTTSGIVRIKGDLYVDGTTTTINSTTVEIADKVIGIATTCNTNLLTDGAGIGIGSDKTFLYHYNSGTNPSLKSSENLNIASGKGYQINQTEVLNATTLGSGVTVSSLTSVGTLGSLNVSGISTFQSDVKIGVGGTVASFDVSGGKLGIGVVNPNTKLHVKGSNAPGIRLQDADGTNQYATFVENGGQLFINSRNDTSRGIIAFRGENSTDVEEFMRITSTGDVGIGTDNPTAKLDVNGTVNVSGIATFNDHIIATSKFTIGDVDSIAGGAPIDRGVIGVYGTGRDMLTLQTNDNSQDRGIAFRNNGDKYAAIIALTDRGSNRVDMIFGIAPSSTNTYNNPDNVPELLRLTKEGSVGIGSTQPTAKLDVAGIVSATSFFGDGSNLTGITAGIGTTASINTSGIITASSFFGDGSGLTGISTFSGNYNDLTNTPTIPTNNNQLSNGAGYITTSFTNTSQLINDAGFITNNVSGVLTATSFSGDGSALTGIASAVWSTNGNEAYYTSGKVGIGTNNPDVLLDIRSTQPILRLHDTDATNAYTNITNLNGNMYLGARNDSSDGVLLFGGYGGNTFTEFFRASSTAFTIDTNGNQRFRITSVGNVGIGSTQPTAKLDVDGHTELDNLNVSGIATAGILTATTLRGLNAKVYNVLEVDNVSWFDGGAEFGPRYFNKGYASISTAGIATFAGVNVSGVSTFAGAIDANGGLDVSGGVLTANNNINTYAVRYALSSNTRLAFDASNEISLRTGSGSIFKVKDDKVGINSTTPTANLDVNGTVNVSGVSTFQGNVNLGDNNELRFGAGNDLKLWHNGFNSIINDEGVGDLYLGGNSSVNITNGALSEFKAKFITDGAVELYHDASKKFETTSTGIDVTGLTETDTLNVSGVSTFKNDVQFHNAAGLTTVFFDQSDETLKFSDSAQLRLGDGGDLQLFHNGSASLIRQTGTGSLFITNTTDDEDIVINTDDGSGGTANYFRADGSTGEAILYHYGTQKFATKSNGIDVTGHTETDTLNVSGLSTFQDDVLIAVNNKKLTFGTGSNLQIYHIDNTDGSVIDATSNGLTIGAGNFQVKNSAGTKTSAHFRSAFGQDLYYNNSLKFVTTGIGVSIANGTSDIATIAGPETLILDPAAVGDNTGTVRIKGDFIVDGTTTTVNSTTVDIADKVIGIATTCSSDLLTDGAGIGIGTNKTFLYEHNSGTNPSLKASENLNVPTGKGYQVNQVEVLNATTLGSSVVNSSLTSVGTLGALTVSGDVSIADKIIHTGDTNTAIRFPAADTFTVETAGTERVRVTSDGKVGIGTANPSVMNHIYAASSLYTRFEQFDGKKVNFGMSNGDGIIDVTGANPLRVLVNGDERFRITSDGKFGFGTGSSIDERGHIETSTGTCRLKLQTGNTGVAGFVLQTSAIRFDIQAQNNFFQIYDNTVDEERLRITSNGNVGIGTLSPTQKLDVAGNIAIKETTVVGSATSSLSTVSQTAIHSAPIATYRSVEYTIQATQGTNFHVTKILAVHDGTTAYNSEYGTIFNNSSVATFDTDVSGGNLRLLATGASASQTDYVINFVGTKV